MHVPTAAASRSTGPRWLRKRLYGSGDRKDVQVPARTRQKRPGLIVKQISRAKVQLLFEVEANSPGGDNEASKLICHPDADDMAQTPELCRVRRRTHPCPGAVPKSCLINLDRKRLDWFTDPRRPWLQGLIQRLVFVSITY